MTDWDASIDDADTGQSAFIALLCLVVRVAYLPFDLFARLGQGPRSDALDEQSGADWSAEGSFQLHNDSAGAA